MIQETIRTPVWFAAFWVEASADPNAQGGTVAIAGAPPKILAKLIPPTLLPLGAPGAQTGSQGAATGVTMVANNRGLLFQTLPVWYPRAPNEADLNQVPSTPQLPSGQTVISVSLLSLDGRYHPRIANLQPPQVLAASGTPTTIPTLQYVALRPSLKGTSISESGALAMNLNWSAAPLAASWAVVTLTCSRPGASYTFTGQADVNGDVIVPLTGLPPLPLPTSPSDIMTLSVQADQKQSGVTAGCDTDALLALSPTPVLVSGSSTVVSTLPIKRGVINTAAMAGFAAGFTLQAPAQPSS
ncbi:MAG: hypothetical protein JO223_13655 [Hyphomicrobiales bacterium]|nr:hypothetical protein [Hyphomicrobiales bacterium]MBV8441507.1 hypothetical protein [Hyphomicrobiales bacterium]